MNESIIQYSEALRPYLGSLQKRALVVGLVGLIAAVAGYFVDHEQFFRSYLLAFTFWIGLPMGCLVILMIHHVGGGTWGFAVRRLLEAGTRTLPLMFLFALPILFLGIHHLYEWSHTEVVAKDAILQQKVPYLNQSFFVVRTFAYFAIWGLMVYLLNKWSRQQDEMKHTFPTHRMQILSGPGIVIYALTMTLATMDWLMSLEPHWYSTIFAVIYMIGQALMTWAFMVLVAVPLSHRQPLDSLLTNQRLRDLGTFMLACVMLWAYTSFSQLLIIWSGNLPEEITYYMTRLEGGWEYVGYGLLLFHFVLPFLLLISRVIKSHVRILVVISVGLLFMRLLDLYWITAPAFTKIEGSFHSTGISLHWLDVAMPLGIGGVLISFFFSQLKNRSLIALNDPRFANLLSGDSEHHG